LRRAIPGLTVACGMADKHLVEDPQVLFDQRYNFLRQHHGIGFSPTPTIHAGATCKVDRVFRGGERIRIGSDWELEVLHLPGHSAGHLALYDRVHKCAFVSDAVHGSGCPKADGSMAIPVTYYHLDTYLTTIRQLETLELETLYTGHWPVMQQEEVKDFLADSRRTVDRLDRVILSALKRTGTTGLTLAQLIDEALTEFPEWPVDTSSLAMFSLKGHLDRLEENGKVVINPAAAIYRWTIA